MAQSNLARKFDEDDDQDKSAIKPGHGAVAPRSGNNRGNLRALPGGNQGDGQPKGNLQAVPDQSEDNQDAPQALTSSTDALKKAHGDPKQMVADAADQYLHVGKKIGNTLFVIWGILFFATGFFPILGLFAGLGAFWIFNLLLFSPKTVYRITELILDAVGIGELLQAGDKAGLSKTNISLSGWAKAGIIVLDVGFFLWHLIFAFSIFYSVCQVANLGSNIPGVSTVLNVGARGADFVTGLPISQLRPICQSMNGIFSNLSPGGGSGYSGGKPSGSVADYYGFIDQSAQANGVEYCMIEALVRKESGGKYNIYSTFVLREDGGSGQVYPPGYIDVNHPDKKFYGLSFDPYGHAIGLTQISIYRNRSTWQDASTPSRSRAGFGGSSGQYFTITDLLNPAANIAAGTAYYADLLKRANGDPVRAYGYYQGGPGVSNSVYNSPQFQKTLQIFNKYYQECKTRI